MSRPCSSLRFLLATAALLLIQHHIPLASATSVVEDACRAAASADSSIDYYFCVICIRQGPLSVSTNSTVSIASIAVGLTSDAAKGGREMIHGLLRGGRGAVDANTKRALKSCRTNYRFMSSRLADAQRAIGSGDLGAAKTCLRAAVEAPKECEKGIARLGAWSPVTDMNRNTKKLATIAVAMTNML